MDILPRNKKLRIHSTKLRNEPTPQERHLWYDFRRGLSPQWNRQRIIGNYIVDFFCSQAGLVIEIDGGQHYNEAGLVEYDQLRTEYLEAQGLKVLRFTNFEIDHYFVAVCEGIRKEIDLRTGAAVNKGERTYGIKSHGEGE